MNERAVDLELADIIKRVQLFSTGIREQSQNEEDYFMLDFIASGIADDLKLIRLFAE